MVRSVTSVRWPQKLDQVDDRDLDKALAQSWKGGRAAKDPQANLAHTLNLTIKAKTNPEGALKKQIAQTIDAEELVERGSNR